MRDDELFEMRGDDVVSMLADDLTRVARVRDRLYREDRLDGDAQRDLAHLLGLVVESAVEAEEADVATPWRTPDERPRPGVPCLVALDVGDNTGAGLDECFAVAYHSGTRWHDVHQPENPIGDVWVVAWMPIPASRLPGPGGGRD